MIQSFYSWFSCFCRFFGKLNKTQLQVVKFGKIALNLANSGDVLELQLHKALLNFCFKVVLVCIISKPELLCARFSANCTAWFICFTRDSSSCLTELIRSILFQNVISKDYKSCHVFVIACWAASDTSCLVIVIIISTSSEVFSSFLISSRNKFAFSLMVPTFNMMYFLSPCSAFSITSKSWPWWSSAKQTWQMHASQEEQKYRILSFLCCEKNGGFSKASRSSVSRRPTQLLWVKLVGKRSKRLPSGKSISAWHSHVPPKTYSKKCGSTILFSGMWRFRDTWNWTEIEDFFLDVFLERFHQDRLEVQIIEVKNRNRLMKS